MLLCGESNSKLNHMKVRTILFAALSLAALHANAQRIKGSDTVLPVAQQTAERFMNREPDARVTVTGGGTGVGISALMDNTTDIAMASRPIKFSEKMKAKAAKRDIDEVIVAYDALAVVVHPSNPVKNSPAGNWKTSSAENNQLETSGRRRPQDRGLLSRDLFRHLRVLQRERPQEQELYEQQSLHARHRSYYPICQPDQRGNRLCRARLCVAAHQDSVHLV